MLLSELNQVHLWKRSSGSGALGGHGKHSGDAQRHSGRSGIHIDPERHPGEDDDEEWRNVHLDQVVTHLSLQVKVNFYAGEFTCPTARENPNQRPSQVSHGKTAFCRVCVCVCVCVLTSVVVFRAVAQLFLFPHDELRQC